MQAVKTVRAQAPAAVDRLQRDPARDADHVRTALRRVPQDPHGPRVRHHHHSEENAPLGHTGGDNRSGAGGTTPVGVDGRMPCCTEGCRQLKALKLSHCGHSGCRASSRWPQASQIHCSRGGASAAFSASRARAASSPVSSRSSCASAVVVGRLQQRARLPPVPRLECGQAQRALALDMLGAQARQLRHPVKLRLGRGIEFCMFGFLRRHQHAPALRQLRVRHARPAAAHQLARGRQAPAPISASDSTRAAGIMSVSRR